MADKQPHGKGLQHAPALSSTKLKELERGRVGNEVF